MSTNAPTNAPAFETMVEAQDIESEMHALGRQAREAAHTIALADPEAKNAALLGAARHLRGSMPDILAANARDMAAARSKGLSDALLDRLLLTEERVEAMAKGLEDIAAQPDPIGRVLEEWERPNGLKIAKVTVPLGVIGIIYESRPNVTADAGALCLKSGNAAILRGGSESYHSSGAILDCLRQGLKAAELPAAAIQRVPTTDRAAVGVLLRMSDFVDVIVPRGGRGLIERVREEATVPVFSHLDGICHTYVQASADPVEAVAVVHNAKLRRPGICGATETLLVDRDAVESHLRPILEALLAAGCEIRGDETVRSLDSRVVPASEADWDTEYLAPILSVKVVMGIDEAIEHVNAHGSHHTEAILTGDMQAARRFTGEVDAGIVMVNASTQFADGGEFGMGAEIGISTGKLHARGPVGAAQLTSTKYVVTGSGHTRP
jgi:glutamate-5-semialdehyde dehydrogenase